IRTSGGPARASSGDHQGLAAQEHGLSEALASRYAHQHALTVPPAGKHATKCREVASLLAYRALYGRSARGVMTVGTEPSPRSLFDPVATLAPPNLKSRVMEL